MNERRMEKMKRMEKYSSMKVFLPMLSWENISLAKWTLVEWKFSFLLLFVFHVIDFFFSSSVLATSSNNARSFHIYFYLFTPLFPFSSVCIYETTTTVKFSIVCEIKTLPSSRTTNRNKIRIHFRCYYEKSSGAEIFVYILPSYLGIIMIIQHSLYVR